MTMTELRDHDAPLTQVIESFFRANYDISTKTETWYRQNLRGFVRFVERRQGRAAVLGDINKPVVDAFLKERRSIPTRKYPSGSQFAVRAAAVRLKRFSNYLAEDGILADSFGGSVLKQVKRGKVDDDVRRPLSDSERDRIITAASHLTPLARAVSVFGFGCGARLNELREAVVGDVDFGRGEFHVRPETSKLARAGRSFSTPQ